jgi:hypothetical protein
LGNPLLLRIMEHIVALQGINKRTGLCLSLKIDTHFTHTSQGKETNEHIASKETAGWTRQLIQERDQGARRECGPAEQARG